MRLRWAVLGMLVSATAVVAPFLADTRSHAGPGTDYIITAPDTVDEVGRWTSITLDASSNPVVSYEDWTNHDLKVMHCNDPNCSGDDESITTPDTGGEDWVGSYSSIALDVVGNPVVSYFDSSNLDLKVMHCNDPNCAGNNESITTADTGGTGTPPSYFAAGRYSSLKLDANGNPVIAYMHDGPAYAVKLMHCNDPNCVGGNESITSPDQDGSPVGEFLSMELDANGNPVMSYHKGISSQDLRVMHCNDPNCAGNNESITSPDTVGNVGTYTSLELDGSGYPVVSYYDWTNYDLKLMHCNDPNCAGNNESITSPDTVGDVGGDGGSLKLDTSGNPLISYRDATNGALKLLYCGNPNCTAGNQAISPDNVGDVGGYASMILDKAGRPVVSYYDWTNQDLKMLTWPAIPTPVPTATSSARPTDTPSATMTPSATPSPTATTTPSATPPPTVTTPSGSVGPSASSPVTPTASPTRHPTPRRTLPPFTVKGDADCDGRVTDMDVVIALGKSIGMSLAISSCKPDLDLDCSGSTDFIDVLVLLYYRALLFWPLPANCSAVGTLT